jgi:hypothetical protein
LLSNFGIQSLVHLCFEIWRNFILKSVTRNRLGARARVPARRRTPRATSSPPYPGCARTPRRQEIQRSEARADATVHLELMTCTRGLGRCHAACAHSPTGEPPFPIGRRLHCTSPPPRAHAGAPVGNEGEAKPPLCATGPINPLPLSLARPSNLATRRRLPLAPPVILLHRSRP